MILSVLWAQAMNVTVILETFITHQELQAKPIIFNQILKPYKPWNVSSAKDCKNHLVQLLSVKMKNLKT